MIKEENFYRITDKKDRTTDERDRKVAMEAFSVSKFHVVEVRRITTYLANSTVEMIISTQMKSIKDFSPEN